MLKPLEYLYILVAVIELFAEITGNNMLRLVSKPLLMIVLIAFYIKSIAGDWQKLNKLMVGAFFFSWLGDVALMFVLKNENFFLAGLVGFLITHILYAIAFANVADKQARALLPKNFWVLIPLAIYMAVLLALLVPGINSNEKTKPFLIPVIVYSAAIATMVVFALNRFKRVGPLSFRLVIAGALMFMFSDSIIAINKFLHPFDSASIYIMLLYISGQYLIAKGVLAQFNRGN